MFVLHAFPSVARQALLALSRFRARCAGRASIRAVRVVVAPVARAPINHAVARLAGRRELTGLTEHTRARAVVISLGGADTLAANA